MTQVSIHIDATQIQSTFARISVANRNAALAAIGDLLVKTSIMNIRGRTGPDGPWPKTPLSDLFAGPRIWTDIIRAMRSEVQGDRVIVGNSDKRAPVRQLGTVGAGGELPDIVPIAKKALTIPISEAASKASYAGMNAKAAFPGAFVVPAKKGFDPASIGCLAQYQGTGKNKKLVLLYKLVAKVAIRRHAFLPVDVSGQLAPATLWSTINDLLFNCFVGGTA